MYLCQYKNIFGKEGEGAHSMRLFDIAVVDYILTILAAYTLSKYFKIAYWKMHIGVFLLAIFLHRLFCVNTTLNKAIFGII